MEYNIITIFDLLLSVIAIIFLIIAIRKSNKNFSAIFVRIALILLMASIAVYSVKFLYDINNGIKLDARFYNWFGSYIRIWNCITVTIIGILATVKEKLK